MRQPRFGVATLASIVALAGGITTCALPESPDPGGGAPCPVPGAAALGAGASHAGASDAVPSDPLDPPGAVAVLSSTWWGSPHHGGAGERSFSVECDPGWIAVGLHGRAGDRIGRVGLVCRYLRSDGTLGPEAFGRNAGGETGQSFLLMCPDGYAIGGVGGRAGEHLDRLQIVCDTLPGTTLVYSNFAGGPGGTPFTDLAPHRYFLTKLVGHSGVHVDGLWSVYHKVDP